MPALSIMLTLLALGPVELIAHRGESADAPENTLAAFNLAWERSAPAIELDVHLTRDGELVCSHDGNTTRTTKVLKFIKVSDYAELKTLDAGSWKELRFKGERMPLLSEALATIPEKARCFIEVKIGPEAIEPLVKVIEASGKSNEQLAIISFNSDTVAAAKKALPKIKAFYLSGFRRDEATGQYSPTAAELIATARKINADGLDLSHDGPWDEKFVAEIRAAKLELYAWTVDDPAIARRLIQLGVDGITTNKVKWLRDELAK